MCVVGVGLNGERALGIIAVLIEFVVHDSIIWYVMVSVI